MKRNAFLWLLICIMFMLGGCADTSMTGDILYLRGVEHYNNGEYVEAIEKLEEAAEKAELKRYEASELYTCLAHCYIELDMYDEAIEWYHAALEEDDDKVEYVVNLAVAYRQSGDNKKAMELYQLGLEIDPDYAELNSSLGSLYILENEPEKAVDYFNKAIELNPSLSVPYGNGALAYAMIGDFETAEEYLEMAIARGYENADVLRERIDALR